MYSMILVLSLLVRCCLSGDLWVADRRSGNVRGRRASVACPAVATSASSDANGDCMCPLEKLQCFQNDRPSCLRSDGTRDFHFFAAMCETCDCRPDGGALVGGLPPRTCGREEVLPDVFGFCNCPEERPVCIMTRTELANETLGCEVAPGGAVHQHQFPVGCSTCSCRASCPSASRSAFADGFGDCACPAAAPVCYELGSKGCISAALGGSTSNTYFRSSCEECECHAQTGSCDLAKCVNTNDCTYAACVDCEVCLGVSRCPEENVASRAPDRKSVV